jgi:hypothetical protein
MKTLLVVLRHPDTVTVGCLLTASATFFVSAHRLWRSAR